MADNVTVSPGDLDFGALGIATKETSPGVHRQIVLVQPEPVAAAANPGSTLNVGTTSVQAFASNPARRSFSIAVPSTATAPVFVRLGAGTAVVGAGVPVYPGGFHSRTDYTGAVQVVASAATPVALQEV